MPTEAYLKRLQRVEPYAEMWRDDKKFVELRAGLYATLLFEHVHPMVDGNEAVREALIESWKDYWQVVGAQNQKWIYRFEAGVHGYKLPSAKVPPIDVLLRDPESFGNYQYVVHGGKNEDDASEHLFDLAAFDIYGAPEFSKDLGYLRLQAPLSYLTNGRLPSFVQLVKRCAARLKVDQAHGGLGFLRTYNEESTTRFTEGQLSKVFSGVDVDVPYIQMGRLFRGEEGLLGIDSPHWLNFLNDHWVAKLGGIEALRAQLPEETFVVEPYDGGVFIQAGAYPEPGHRDDGLPPAYVWLNRVLKPVRAPEMVYCMGDEPGQLARYQGAHEYFTRFDAASAKLADYTQTRGSASADGSSALTSLGASTAGLRCEAGQPCPREGWWFTPARLDSRRRFSRGEVLPEIGGEYGATIWQWDEQQ
jgi:Protein of unknown function (DUF3396)